ncbi:hypothetical protein CPC08DRAFT_767217 [Agrocybe pediades]|nr:hypothetical protein CPC08DRAFT_767217 [Agrocybe pediades]
MQWAITQLVPVFVTHPAHHPPASAPYPTPAFASLLLSSILTSCSLLPVDHRRFTTPCISSFIAAADPSSSKALWSSPPFLVVVAVGAMVGTVVAPGVVDVVVEVVLALLSREGAVGEGSDGGDGGNVVVVPGGGVRDVGGGGDERGGSGQRVVVGDDEEWGWAERSGGGSGQGGG